jgi:hypothetical protein
MLPAMPEPSRNPKKRSGGMNSAGAFFSADASADFSVAPAFVQARAGAAPGGLTVLRTLFPAPCRGRPGNSRKARGFAATVFCSNRLIRSSPVRRQNRKA